MDAGQTNPARIDILVLQHCWCQVLEGALRDYVVEGAFHLKIGTTAGGLVLGVLMAAVEEFLCWYFLVPQEKQPGFDRYAFRSHSIRASGLPWALWDCSRTHHFGRRCGSGGRALEHHFESVFHHGDYELPAVEGVSGRRYDCSVVHPLFVAVPATDGASGNEVTSDMD